MREIDHLVQGLRETWRALPVGQIERNCIVALALLVVFYLLVLGVESASRSRTGNYKTREFFHDVVFWFYFRSGLNWILFMAAMFAALDGQLKFLDLGLLKPYPMIVQVLVFLLVADFFVYWSHRAMHRFKFLWAFHTTHHAPEHITFASSARFHPVEVILQYFWYYALIRIFGGNPLAWLPILVIMELNLEAQHTQIPWRLGPLYRVFVTPAFHAYHHSTDPAHYDKNFSSGMFSFWDYLFGTAVAEDSPPPRQLGLPDVKMPTLWSTVATPFRLALRGLTGRGEEAPHGNARVPG
jgi:sterol desaturase/sphingolipid hydroxylase (fatty acid hydroxylase superfamily)